MIISSDLHITSFVLRIKVLCLGPSFAPAHLAQPLILKPRPAKLPVGALGSLSSDPPPSAVWRGGAVQGVPRAGAGGQRVALEAEPGGAGELPRSSASLGGN